MARGLLIIVSGASGTGKGTVCKRLLEEMPEMEYSISATTRTPRAGELDASKMKSERQRPIEEKS